VVLRHQARRPAAELLSLALTNTAFPHLVNRIVGDVGDDVVSHLLDQLEPLLRNGEAREDAGSSSLRVVFIELPHLLLPPVEHVPAQPQLCNNLLEFFRIVRTPWRWRWLL
jgi:hypothetical protein